jgi:hypothetical protein
MLSPESGESKKSVFNAGHFKAIELLSGDNYFKWLTNVIKSNNWRALREQVSNDNSINFRNFFPAAVSFSAKPLYGVAI